MFQVAQLSRTGRKVDKPEGSRRLRDTIAPQLKQYSMMRSVTILPDTPVEPPKPRMSKRPRSLSKVVLDYTND